MQEIFQALNEYVLGHPGALKLLQLLMWISWWMFLGMMGLILYEMYAGRQKYLARERHKEKLLGKGKDRFVA